MTVLVYVEAVDGKYKKTAFEACSYGSKLAQLNSANLVALTNADSETASELASYGVNTAVSFKSNELHDSALLSSIIADAAKKYGAESVILTDDSRAKALLGRLAVKLDAAVVSGASSLPESSADFQVSKSIFSSKAIGHYSLKSSNKVISVARNSVGVHENTSELSHEEFDASGYSSSIELLEVKRVKGTVPLPEAELVVSAGRGMKDPENWGIVEELADTLGATTACSRPVSDSGWRPHHEHVGQTGIAIKPNLYIAIGISGAIQHLAGVNNSKTIVVINKDPEAPFFKAADYGVVGDLFDVVPRLNDAIKKQKNS